VAVSIIKHIYISLRTWNPSFFKMGFSKYVEPFFRPISLQESQNSIVLHFSYDVRYKTYGQREFLSGNLLKFFDEYLRKIFIYENYKIRVKTSDMIFEFHKLCPPAVDFSIRVLDFMEARAFPYYGSVGPMVITIYRM
jgi:hypothetical protein